MKYIIIVIYIEVKIGNEIKLIYLTNQLIDYFIKEYNISSQNDLIDENIIFDIESKDKIIVNGELDIDIYSDLDEFIPNLEVCNTNKERKKLRKINDKYIEKVNNTIRCEYHKSHSVGAAKITNYNNEIESGTSFTNITVCKDDLDMEFVLEYPQFYGESRRKPRALARGGCQDESHPVVDFINKVGGGSVHGLDGSEIELVPEDSISNPAAVKDGLAIKSKDKQNKNNKSKSNQVINYDYIISRLIGGMLISCWLCIIFAKPILLAIGIISLILLVFTLMKLK